MRGHEEIRRCKCGCKNELPDRYKGRQREFFTAECRKNYHLGTSPCFTDK